MLDIAKPSPATAALRPSEYTAALIHVLRRRPECVQGAKVLEMGCGSGVVLAALGAMGATSLSGVDIEDEAVSTGRLLLRELGHDAQLFRGDMWQPVAGRRFDLIVANLPHFPMEHVEVAGRLPTWSSGGVDGREFLDSFLEGLADHFTAKARAVLTHNAFVDVERSRVLAARHGLALTVLASVLVHIANEKLALMTPSVLLAEDGKSIHRYGPHVFADLHIVEIAPVGTQS
ncbi:methyltransferase domain-containing protein [Reyranella sp.]|uniref:methyltransferase domain-containing protein n=1 Tax=Reyranella sp. TaxID=1929291 RepID=UPI001219EDA5|nr:methyltransferase domain-containing protein [Reyranella sp.]TAJ83728.1 MAG: methyltransferase domain-containing protein [Reyranella sp.]